MTQEEWFKETTAWNKAVVLENLEEAAACLKGCWNALAQAEKIIGEEIDSEVFSVMVGRMSYDFDQMWQVDNLMKEVLPEED